MNILVQAQNYANDAKTCLTTVYFISAPHVRTALRAHNGVARDLSTSTAGAVVFLMSEARFPFERNRLRCVRCIMLSAHVEQK